MIQLSCPAHLRVSLYLVEILDVRGIDGAFLKAKPTQSSIDRDDIKDPVHTKGDRQSPMFRQTPRLRMSRSVPLLSASTAGSSRKVNSSLQCL